MNFRKSIEGHQETDYQLLWGIWGHSQKGPWTNHLGDRLARLQELQFALLHTDWMRIQQTAGLNYPPWHKHRQTRGSREVRRQEEVFIKFKWCNPQHVTTPNIELMAVGLRPYCLACHCYGLIYLCIHKCWYLWKSNCSFYNSGEGRAAHSLQGSTCNIKIFYQ